MQPNPSLPSYPDPEQQRVHTLASELEGLFQVSGVHVRGRDEQITFVGHFEQRPGGYDELRQRFQAYGYTPLLRRGQQQDLLVALEGVIEEGRTGNPLLNVLLLVVTTMTTLAAGAAMRGQDGLFAALLAGEAGKALRLAVAGAPFTATLLGILGVHELGHYLAARYHGVRATLPYFIPMPVGGLGTLGAFISVRSPMKNRTVLFDIGLAGPLAGFVVALPLLVGGLLLSEAVPSYTQGLTLNTLGNSLLVKGVTAVFVELPARQTLALHPVYFAAWFGILITGINLLPIGQLDGGHVAYALFGDQAHHVARGTLVLLLVAGVALSSTWLLWALFVLFGGLHHPPPLNNISEVNRPRQWLGIATIMLFFLIITPVPFRG
jgi:hypothetical protein